MFKPVWVKPLEDYKAISWGDDIDICPDAIYFEITDIDPEQYFRESERLVVNA